jgi:hypothetical protein
MIGQPGLRPIQTREVSMPPRRLAAAGTLALLVLALGVAGCGSSSTKTTSTVAMTKPEYVAKANAICASADPVLQAGEAKLATLPKAKIAAVVEGTFAPSIEGQISGIRALGAPSGEQATVASMLTLAQADLDKLKRSPALIETDVFAGFAKAAHAYGLTACAPTS